MFDNSGFSDSNYDAAIYDQGQLGACVENSICAGIQNLLNQAGYHVAPDGTAINELGNMEYTAPSRQYLYNEQLIDIHHQGVDYGSYTAATYKAAETHGIAPEYDLPYGPDNLPVIPSDSVNADAQNMKIVSEVSFSTGGISVPSLKAIITKALQQGHEVQVALTVHSSLYYESADNLTYDSTTPVIGGHDLNIVGIDYSTSTPKIIFQNSWGDNWGKGGYGEMTFNQLLNATAYGQDLNNLDYITAVQVNGHLVDTTWTASKTLMTDAYLVLGRTADFAGLSYWASTIDNGNTLANVVDSFINSAEGQVVYGGKSDADFIDNVYVNLFGHHADASGDAYWASTLGSQTKAQAAMAIMHSAQGTDATALFNRSLVVGNGSITYQDDGTHHDADVAALVGVTSDYATVIGAQNVLHHAIWGA